MDERWSDDGKRADGLRIIAALEGYVIMPAHEGLPLDRCPCCDKAFPIGERGLRGARLVADMIYRFPEAIDADG